MRKSNKNNAFIMNVLHFCRMKMSLKNISVFLLSLSPLIACGKKEKTGQPKLVIGIVIDQMRWDYLYRFKDRYTDDGFKRIMKDGFNCQNTMINYLPTFTAPGHTCVYTGSVPALHGIVSNDWYDNVERKAVYCTEDADVMPVGSNNERAGKMSPKNMLATTITDELRLSNNMSSRVYGIAIKDRGSILPAGHLGNGAYWFDDKSGNFISSTYYGKDLPGWMNTFNGQKLSEQYIKTTWETLYPIATYKQSLVDNNSYEGKLKGETAPVFPHTAKSFDGANYNALRYMPLGNTLIFDAAKACIEGEQMGGRGYTDFLCLSFSSTDYAGHLFAPNSIEVEDMYLRLDRDLAAFLEYLDKQVGKGQYTVFITADHGGAHNSKYMEDVKIPAGSANDSVVRSQLNLHLKSIYSKDTLVREMSNYQVYLDEAQIINSAINRYKLKEDVMQWLRKQKGVAYAVDIENKAPDGVPEPLKTMIVNGYNSKRSGCIQIILEPAWYSGYGANTGTTHGSWNPYDMHIPLLWYGAGIPKGETNRKVHMTDISATLAALLHIQMPNACVGEVITEIVR
jgi:predicted AlkP superfamily pyrophosphatase or phosphodiesterase